MSLPVGCCRCEQGLLLVVQVTSVHDAMHLTGKNSSPSQSHAFWLTQVTSYTVTYNAVSCQLMNWSLVK